MIDNFDEYLYNLLPSIYRKLDKEQKPYPEPLKRFLKILVEGGFNPLIQEIDKLANTMDMDTLESKYFPLITQSLGIEFPYNMTERELRKYLKIIPTLYRLKGTYDSFNYLAREIFNLRTKVETKKVEYEEGMPPEEWRKILINLEVDGTIPDLRKKEENFRKFIELIRPVNTIILLNLTLMYYDKYFRDANVKDYGSKLTIYENNFDLYNKLIEESVFSSLTIKAESDNYNLDNVIIDYLGTKFFNLYTDYKDFNVKDYGSKLNMHENNFDLYNKLIEEKGVFSNLTIKAELDNYNLDNVIVDYLGTKFFNLYTDFRDSRLYFSDSYTFTNIKTEEDKEYWIMGDIEKLSKTKFILPNGASKLVTSNNLTTSFHILHYKPVNEVIIH